MDSAHIDFETSSDLDLNEVGVYRYVEHPSTQILCMAHDDRLWYPGDPLPQDLVQWVRDGRMLSAWNAGFERIVWNALLVKHGFPRTRMTQWYDPMQHAKQLNLPASLDGAAAALGLPERKDAEGKRLMRQMMNGKNHTPANLQRLGDYCMQDVRTEHSATQRLNSGWSAREQQVYWLNEQINDRGVKIDRRFVEVAANAVTSYQQYAALQMQNEFRINPTQVQAIQKFCAARRVVLPDLRADTVQTVLDCPDLYPDDVVRILSMRERAAGNAPKKFAAMLRTVCSDDRIRGMSSYYGAGQTGRFSMRIVQWHNVARPTMEYDHVMGLMDTLRQNKNWQCLGNDPLEPLLNMVRPSLIPGHGGVFTVGDESQIEARVIAWLAGCERVLEVFRSGGDIYVHNAGSVPGADRPVGKVITLALGFGGGKNAFVTMGRGYGVHVQPARADEIKVAWRDDHPEYETLWAVLDTWALRAVGHPCEVNERIQALGYVRHVEDNLTRLGIHFEMRGNVLHGVLPSGRTICYPNAKAERKVAKPIERILLDQGEAPDVAAERALRWRVSYWTPQGDHMQRDGGYGGKFSEQFTQAIARDVLCEVMLDVADLPIVLHMHDEPVLEGEHVERLNAALVRPIRWAPGLPLAAEVTTRGRYWKG